MKKPHIGNFQKSQKICQCSLSLVKKKIRTLVNVPAEQVRVALNGLKVFYSQISSVKPDLSNPDILMCYNQTAINYGLQEKRVQLKNQIDVEILDPFAGIQGKTLGIIFNSIAKDKKKL